MPMLTIGRVRLMSGLSRTRIVSKLARLGTSECLTHDFMEGLSRGLLLQEPEGVHRS